MKEIKKLKFQEPHKFKRKDNEDQYKFKLAENFNSAKSAAERSSLEKVKSDLEEGEKLISERNDKNIFPASVCDKCRLADSRLGSISSRYGSPVILLPTTAGSLVRSACP